jgi:V/A-type H+-transporting ATPase subunit E
MEIQVQELMNKIKKDGIESASQEAARLKKEAEAEARQIVEKAQKEAAELIAKAKKDAELSEKAGKAALEQASRNLVLVFKDEIQVLLDKLVAEHLKDAYDGEVLKNALPEIIKSWAAKGDALAVLLPKPTLDKLEAFFAEKLASQLKNGLEIKSDNSLSGGFRIAQKDGSAYYDFSAEAVAEMLSAYLNPQLAEILKTSVKKEA